MNLRNIISSKFFKDIAVVFTSNVTGKLLLFVVYFYLAKRLSVEEYGILTISLSVLSTLSNLSSIGLNQSISRFTTVFNRSNQKVKLNNLFSTTLISLLVIGVVVMLIVILLSNKISYLLFNTDRSILIIASSFGIPIILIYQMHIAFYSGMQNFKRVFILSVVPNLFLLFIIFFLPLKLLSINILFAFIPITFLIIEINHIKKVSLIYDVNILRETMGFGKWMSLQAIILIIQSRLDTYLLAYYTSPEQVSYYDIAFKFQGLILFSIGAYNTVLKPKMTSLKTNDELIKYVRQTIKVVSILSVLIGIVAIVAPFILNFIFGEKYNDSNLPLRIMVFALIPHIWIFPFNDALFAKAISKPFFITVSIQLFANIIASVILLPIYGALGAAISYFIINIIALIMSLFFYNRHIRLGYKMNKN